MSTEALGLPYSVAGRIVWGGHRRSGAPDVSPALPSAPSRVGGARLGSLRPGWARLLAPPRRLPPAGGRRRCSDARNWPERRRVRCHTDSLDDEDDDDDDDDEWSVVGVVNKLQCETFTSTRTPGSSLATHTRPSLSPCSTTIVYQSNYY